MRFFRFCLISLCCFSFSVLAVPEHPWYVGGGVGYGFQHQDLKYTSSIATATSSSSAMYESLDFAHGLYSHANLGFYINSMNRLKLGYAWFPSKMNATANGEDKGTWKFDNEIFIFEYDFLFPMPAGFSWASGVQLGHIKSILTEIKNKGQAAYKPSDVDLGGFSYGFQTGFEFHVAQVVMGLKGIFLMNSNTKTKNIVNNTDTYKVREDYSILIDFSLGFVF